MALPFFYKEDIVADAKSVTLDEDTSKHMVQVLRMQNGEQLQLTDGKGHLFTCEVTDNNRKRCSVAILNTHHSPLTTHHVSIAISLLKNTSRFEWFLEKATEIGVTGIIPLICERTEKTAFKFERLNSILISAMLQSQQTFLPVLHEPVKFDKLATAQFENTVRFIAHCEEGKTKQPLHSLRTAQYPIPIGSPLILIGPEGDFTPQEIELALQNGFTPVSLGNTRLRSETAGMVAAVTLRL